MLRNRESAQSIEAFREDQALRFLVRDRDSIYGEHFRKCVMRMAIEQVVIAYWAPLQNPFVQRLNGSLRRECLNHCIVVNERYLRRILST
ncbi:MAG: hypothetical protein IH897_08815 [Planctomycetes bacterium]|nr:hypothetical protein [Planctomycetota bacterium]